MLLSFAFNQVREEDSVLDPSPLICLNLLSDAPVQKFLKVCISLLVYLTRGQLA